MNPEQFSTQLHAIAQSLGRVECVRRPTRG